MSRKVAAHHMTLQPDIQPSLSLSLPGARVAAASTSSLHGWHTSSRKCLASPLTDHGYRDAQQRAL